ncbi:MAG: MurR/RpiR family transcriptional regulator [Brachybacterium sp.]|nr:MurR/RpiR family transcriptional regulator [Brachybacterium sp.]
MTPSLQPSERRVVDAIAADLAAAVECTAQELANRVGVGRASVIRTAKSLGYDGFPQMRVALARELSFLPSRSDDDNSVGLLRGTIEKFGHSLPRLTEALTEEAVTDFVAALHEARRVVIVAAGLSAPLGLDAAMRLSSAGRPAEFLQDSLAQQIAAGSLEPDSVCLVISGSGATKDSLAAASAARAAGATVLVMTSFARAPLVALADAVMVIPPVSESFPDELLHTSRAALALVIESLVQVLLVYRGDRGREAREAALSLVEKRLKA